MDSKFKLTPAQEKAVNTRDRTMLVSAAAGSGKTAVLTQRIITMLTDEKNPVDISELLVVTYTKAAASELRMRISEALNSALTASPDSKRLAEQLLELGKARISTIHSFCFDLVKSNFQLLNLPAHLRIADEAEADLISNSVMNDIIDAYYEGDGIGDNIRDFAAFADQFASRKDDSNMALELLGKYKYIRNYPEGIEILKNTAGKMTEASEKPVFGSLWGKLIKDELLLKLNYFKNVLSSACRYFEGDEVFANAYLPAFEDDLRFYTALCNMISNELPLNDIKAFIASYTPVSLKSVKSSQKTEDSEFYKNKRNSIKKEFSVLKSNYLDMSEEVIKAQFIKTAELSMALYELFARFEKEFANEKNIRGVLDYSDLERYSVKLLYNEDGTFSNTAKAISDKFKAVFIDEYQDVNELQDLIFRAVSKKRNRFMVGDIKQSIYGFKGSTPQLFSDYRSAFPEYKDELPDSDGITLYLSDNFRSDKSVIDFSNAVFEVLFKKNDGKIPYTDGDRLVCSKITDENDTQYKVKVELIDKEQALAANEYSDDRKELTNKRYEAEFIASKIEDMVKEGIRPEKIAILLRSTKNSFVYEDALKKRGIASYNILERDFFENDAVLLMLCLLNTIDNPTRDIYLAGTLKSPLFSFSLDELTSVRMKYKNESLYSALIKYTDENQWKKGRYFLAKLNEWRSYAEACPVDKLIRYIYNDTHIIELLSGRRMNDADNERQANLLLLHEYARRFESSSFKGLYNFIIYLDDVLEKRTRLANAKVTSEGDGVVNIMSIHKSKGLEFDVVFLADTAHAFNRSDEISRFILDYDLGISLKLRHATGYGKYDTFLRRAASCKISRQALEEELRVLYVALTRAKKQLVVTSVLSKPEELLNELKREAGDISYSSLLNCKNMIKLILLGIYGSDYNDCIVNIAQGFNSSSEGEEERIQQEMQTENEQSESDEESEKIGLLEDTFKERFAFDYPYMPMTQLPTKLAVSDLYPSVLDPEETPLTKRHEASMYVKPRFLLPDEEKHSAAEKGTATHVFMQFCDFASVEKNGVEYEINRLKEKGYIDDGIASMTDKKKIADFFKSDVYSDLKHARNIWRERRFNIKLPASDFTTDTELKETLKNEDVLVQGVIDLLYIDSKGKTVLLDYKTDRFTALQKAGGEAERILIERHTRQLSYYAEACKRIFGRPVDYVYIYSFDLGKKVVVSR